MIFLALLGNSERVELRKAWTGDQRESHGYKARPFVFHFGRSEKGIELAFSVSITNP